MAETLRKTLSNDEIQFVFGCTGDGAPLDQRDLPLSCVGCWPESIEVRASWQDCRAHALGVCTKPPRPRQE